LQQALPAIVFDRRLKQAKDKMGVTMFRKKHWQRVVAILALVVALVVPASVGLAQGNLGNPGVLPPNSHPYGKTYVDWSVRWWQWAYSVPISENPIFDGTGADCGVGQSGPVWFLAGTSGGAATRSCTIPPGKAILFPIINVNADYPCPPEYNFEPALGQTLEDFLTLTAQSYMNQPPVTTLEAEVDGVSLQNLFDYRATSHLVTFTGDTSLQAWDVCVTGTPQSGVSDGYWIMLAPLSAGPHTIHFLAEGPWNVDVTYHLTVKR
jgi:hypothetical protein